MKYFVAINDEKRGPFSFDETLTMGISRETLVWKEGFKDWQYAVNLSEYKEHFRTVPPDLPQKVEHHMSKKTVMPGIFYALGFTTISILIFYVLYFYSNFPKHIDSSLNNKVILQDFSNQGLEEDNASYDSTKKEPINLDDITKLYMPSEKLGRAGKAFTTMGSKSKYDDGFNPMYKDKNLYREESFKDDIKKKTNTVFVFLLVFSILVSFVFYFIKNR